MACVVDGFEEPRQLTNRPAVHRQQENNTDRRSLALRVGDKTELPARIFPQGALVFDVVVVQSSDFTQARHVSNQVFALLAGRSRHGGECVFAPGLATDEVGRERDGSSSWHTGGNGRRLYRFCKWWWWGFGGRR